jgi:hypothetical protein
MATYKRYSSELRRLFEEEGITAKPGYVKSVRAAYPLVPVILGDNDGAMLLNDVALVLKESDSDPGAISSSYFSSIVSELSACSERVGTEYGVNMTSIIDACKARHGDFDVTRNKGSNKRVIGRSKILYMSDEALDRFMDAHIGKSVITEMELSFDTPSFE